MQASAGLSADVIVVGSGNAALCAAVSARETGARVLVLEKAPEHFRGGNSYFTAGGFRFAYNGLDDIRQLIPDLSDEEARNIDVGRYDQAKFYEDIMRVTEGLADPALAETLVSAIVSDDGLAARAGDALGAHVRAPSVQGRRDHALLGGADCRGDRRWKGSFRPRVRDLRVDGD